MHDALFQYKQPSLHTLISTPDVLSLSNCKEWVQNIMNIV